MRAVLLVASVLVGCSGGAAEIGEWTIEGQGVFGWIAPPAERAFGADAGPPRVGLWGPGFGTDGMVPAEVSREGEHVTWVFFPIETGVGEGTAALRLEGAEALLPLGGRPAEFDLSLRRREGAPDSARVAAAQAAGQAAVEAERAAWSAGVFRLMDGDTQVGDVSLRSDAPSVVWLYDPIWVTDGPVAASRLDDGGDLLLAFAVQPNFRGEDGLLRVNVPSRRVVVPVGELPDRADRALSLVPGATDPATRQAWVADARAQADAGEAAWIADTAPKLLAEATTPDGACTPFADLDSAWRLLFEGYDVRVVSAPGPTCTLEIEPKRIQHRRRYRGRLGVDGPLPKR